MNATLRAALVLWGALLVSIFGATVWVTPAFAAITEEGAPNIMVRPFDGPKAKALNERVVKVLEDNGADLTPAGFEGPTPLESDADYASVAARLNIQAFVQGTATSDNGGWVLKLTVRQGSDGTVVGGAELKASWFPGLLTKIDEELVPTLEKVLSGAKTPVGAPEEPAAPEPEPEQEKPRPQPLELDAGVGFVFRNFVANKPVNIAGALQTRDQSGGMANLRVGAAFYPMALFTKAFLANIGVVARFEQSLGGKTQAGNDPTGVAPTGDLSTSLSAYDIGLRIRLPIAEHQLGFSATYGQQKFAIDDNASEPDPLQVTAPQKIKLVPDVDYTYIRLGADFKYVMKAYFLRADLGLRIVNSAGDGPGEIQNTRWFPRSDVGGADFGVTAGYALSDRLTIAVGVDWRNFFYTMNSRAADFGVDDLTAPTPTRTVSRNPVAGGANDMYFAGLIAARYTLQ